MIAHVTNAITETSVVIGELWRKHRSLEQAVCGLREGLLGPEAGAEPL